VKYVLVMDAAQFTETCIINITTRDVITQLLCFCILILF